MCPVQLEDRSVRPMTPEKNFDVHYGMEGCSVGSCREHFLKPAEQSAG
jgi:hypothetical protein